MIPKGMMTTCFSENFGRQTCNEQLINDSTEEELGSIMQRKHSRAEESGLGA